MNPEQPEYKPQQPQVISPSGGGASPPTPPMQEVQPSPIEQTPPVVESPGVIMQPEPSMSTEVGPTTAKPRRRFIPKFGKLKASKSKVLAGSAALVFLVLVGVSYYLFLYLPNTPTNVYRHGLAAVGVGLEDILNASFEKDLTNTNFDGKFEMTKPSESSASYSGSYGIDGQLVVNLDAKYGEYNPKLELLLDPNEAGDFPIAYLMLNGFDSVLSQYLSGSSYRDLGLDTDSVDDTWWKFDLEEFVNGGLIDAESADEDYVAAIKNAPTQEDYEKISRAVLEATNDYVFTPDVGNMVLQMVEDRGVEDFEGVSSRKYLVEVNPYNMVAYVKAVRDNIEATGVASKLGFDKPLNEYLSDELIEQSYGDDSLYSDFEIEAWVALNNKVLRNVRFTSIDNEQSEVIVDLSLLLEEGSDDIPFRSRLSLLYDGSPEPDFFSSSLEEGVALDQELTSNGGVIEWGITLNTSNSNVYSYVDVDYNDRTFFGEYKFRVDVNLTGTAESPELDIPTNTKSFYDILGGYITSVQAQARDTERRSDINSMYQKLEEFYNENGYYPEKFDYTSFPGIDQQAMIDPDEKHIEFSLVLDGGIGAAPLNTDTLPDVPQASDYRYYAEGCVSSRCTGYTILARLENATFYGGNLYIKTSLN